MMSTHDQVSLAALENQAISLLGRLHVMLRRESGRITDIEYMRIDAQYCRHVLELAWKSDNPDMRQISEKLAHLYFDPDGLFNRVVQKPLMERLLTPEAPTKPAISDMIATPAVASASHAAEQMHHAEDENDRSYVGRLR